MPSGYEPISSQTDRERELDEAFENDDDDEEVAENTPLNRGNITRDDDAQVQRSSSVTSAASSGGAGAAGGYDFEREYGYSNTTGPGNGPDDWMAPPPGSPTRAMPNNYGNSNGLVPTTAIQAPARAPKPSTPHTAPFWRRALGVVLPNRYAPVPTEDTEASGSSSSSHQTAIGSGIQNDGVFSNLSSKPQAAQMVTVVNENGEAHIVPETTQKDVPPSYVEAQADSVPPYWETTVHAPATATADGEMLVDGLASGPFLTFILTMGISFFFQFVGFLLTYLLHTSHAGKYGSRAGLGLTLIQYGFYSKAAESSGSTTNEYASFWRPHMTATAEGPAATGDDGMMMGMGSRDSDSDASGAITPDDSYVVAGGFSTKDWLSFILMTIGWFLLLSSIIGFCRVKRWERKIRESATNPTPGPSVDELQRDLEIRRNLESVFGLPRDEPQIRVDERGTVVVIPNQQALEEARLTRDLSAAGLL